MVSYSGVAAIGDVQYPDGFDRWDDIKKVFEESKEINITRDHDNDTRVIGVLKNWNIDPTNKLIGIGFDGKDIQDDELDDYMQISPQWKVDAETKRIVGINHIAIGNSFKQLCSKDVCGVSADAPEEPEIPEESDEVKAMKLQLKELTDKIAELEKEKDEKLKLGFKEKHKQPTHTTKEESVFHGIDLMNLTENTEKMKQKYMR